MPKGHSAELQNWSIRMFYFCAAWITLYIIMPPVQERIALNKGEPKYLTISELNRLLNSTLEDNIPQIWFEGEIQELKLAQSGHLYLTLKDVESQQRATMWANVTRALKFKPAAGKFVRCLGKPNVYHKTGYLQIILSKMEEGGEGLLQKKFL
ncbi:MAG: hypothetical protein DCC75_06690, partial [Proteobacteria bacterium]